MLDPEGLFAGGGQALKEGPNAFCWIQKQSLGGHSLEAVEI